MRQKLPDGYEYDSSIPHPVTFRSSDGNVLEITILASNVVRVKHQTGGSSNKCHSNNNEDDSAPLRKAEQSTYSMPSFKVKRLRQQEQSDRIQVETPQLRIEVELPNLRLVWYDKESNDPHKPFAEDLARRAYAYNNGGEEIWHYRKRYLDDAYFGLGERTGPMDLAGRRFRLERLDSMGYDAETQDPLYKFCPFYVTLSSTTKRAHGIYYQNFSTTTVDLGQELDAMWGPYTSYHAESGPLDYVMIYGPSVSSVVRSFGILTGAQRHLPPRFAFGYLASSMGYAEADNAQAQLEQFAKLCRKHDIPCDGMHLSSGYTVTADGDRCVFTWNTQRFPDPEKLAARLKAAGIHIFANVKPWLLHKSHPDYEQLKKAKGVVWDDENDKPSTVWQWRAGRYTMGEASYIDFTSKAGYAYWQEQLRTQLVDKGFLPWLDNNEFAMLDDQHTYACEVPADKYDDLVGLFPVMPEERTCARQVGTSMQTLLMAQASYQVLRAAKPIERPFLITRSSVPFCQQLVTQTWSGDNYTDWKTIRFNIAMGVGASLCAVPSGYGHDVGGFSGPRPDPEMFVRWVQQGIFWSRFCIHSFNTDDTITEPWMYPEVLPTIREAIHLRYKLIPYLYSLHVIYAYRNHEPLIRPVFYNHQDDPKTYTQQFEFMVGPDVLVAPIAHPGETKRFVYLPGQEQQQIGWYHYQSGQYFTGGQTVTVESSLTDAASPVFIRAGSMICFGQVMNNVHQTPDNERRVQIFPERWQQQKTNSNSDNSDDDDHKQQPIVRRTFTMIEDDGKTLYHEQEGKAYAEVRVWMEADAETIKVGLEILNDGYFPDYDTVWVTCPIASETRRLVFIDPQFNAAINLQECPRIVDDTTMHCYYGIPLHFNKKQN
ncbi:glycosyl hydrolases family 31-domain-containing protein [Zychaea mexicana]|uniref:glycosyl hydrolases family 31-domain-containing protein n=1 Tax=Zychaea mexicana TaxID=64656 RepID=UPI0022FE57CF|nr:glycosyl hydrolases family 31-domain-containing protein [Zychaea mexicana]KAI9497623.1 glycosyl hydrolases family 31-domain-containing protein [Zychaea mexicana]